MKIAITGGIGSGKSTVAKLLKESGYAVFSCDEIYKEITILPSYIQEVAKYFPNAVVDGAIDRKKLGEIVFYDEKERKRLNSISHPSIMRALLEKMAEVPFSFAEVPLLFEENLEAFFDKIIYVERDLWARIASVEIRDDKSKETIEKIISSQFNPNSKDGITRLKNPKIVILKNEGDIPKLKNDLSCLIKQFNLS